MSPPPCSVPAGRAPASYSPDVPGTDLVPLFETILNYIPAPEADVDKPFQMLVSSIDYNEFVGRIAIGRIERGVVRQNQEIAVCNFHTPDEAPRKAKATALYQFDGLGRVPVTEATAGNIIAMSGIGDITIGDTDLRPRGPRAHRICEDLPPTTIEMTFSVNDSPLRRAGGQVRHLPPDPGAAVPGDAEGRVPPGTRYLRVHRRLQRGRPW